MDVSDSYVELDIWLRSTAVCGRGFGSDALLIIIRHLSETSGVSEYILRPSRRNARAIRADSKAGFVLLPLNYEQQTRIDGSYDYRDAVVMHKKVSDWRNGKDRADRS